MENRKRLGLTTAIFTGLALGAAVGILLHYAVPEGRVRSTLLIDGAFYLMGNGFLYLMQMLVVPLVLYSLVCGSISIGDVKKLGEIGVRILRPYLATTALAITIAILTARMIDPGAKLDLSTLGTAQVTIREKGGLVDTLLATIPVSPMRTLVDGNMLSIILSVLIVGMVLAGPGKAVQTVGNLLNRFNDVMMQMTVMVVKLAPYGMFCLTVRTFSSIGFDAFLPLLKYMAGVVIALTIQRLVAYVAILKGFTGLSPVESFKRLLPIVGFALSAAAPSATILMSIDALHKKMGVPRRISSLAILLGTTINMDGTTIIQRVIVVSASQMLEIRPSVTNYLTVILTITLASVGMTGVPGMGLITLSMIFASVDLPAGVIALTTGIDRILNMSRAAVSATGDVVCTIVVAFQDGGMDWAVFEDMEARQGG